MDSYWKTWESSSGLIRKIGFLQVFNEKSQEITAVATASEWDEFLLFLEKQLEELKFPVRPDEDYSEYKFLLC